MDTEPVEACPVCGRRDRETLYAALVDRLYGAPGRWRLARCSDCGAAYLDPRPTRESIGAAYKTYYTHEPTPGADGRPGRFRSLEQALRNSYLNARYDYALEPATPFGRLVVPPLPGRRAAADRHVRGLRRSRPGARVLDVGCGNGEFLLEMRRAGWTAEGLETNARAVALARDRSLDVREGTLEDADFPGRSFDAVTPSHVVEHLHDPIAALRRCRELLRRDGRLWLATPNVASRGHIRFGRAWRGLEPPRHLVLFTPSALRRALGRAGFASVEFQRPASARWVYDASRTLSAGRRGSGLADRAAARAADLHAAFRSAEGEELVAVARPA